MDHYISKTFYKTASLMANSCKAVAVLGGHGPAVCQAAWEYGRHLGLAFQVRRLWVLLWDGLGQRHGLQMLGAVCRGNCIPGRGFLTVSEQCDCARCLLGRTPQSTALQAALERVCSAQL